MANADVAVGPDEPADRVVAVRPLVEERRPGRGRQDPVTGRRVGAGDVGIGVADHPDVADLARIHERLGLAHAARHRVTAFTPRSTPAVRQAAIIASISGSVAAIGFSVKTCLPARGRRHRLVAMDGRRRPEQHGVDVGPREECVQRRLHGHPKAHAELLGATSAMDGDQARLRHELADPEAYVRLMNPAPDHADPDRHDAPSRSATRGPESTDPQVVSRPGIFSDIR